jgi:hypothetical protein
VKKGEKGKSMGEYRGKGCIPFLLSRLKIYVDPTEAWLGRKLSQQKKGNR